MSSQLLDLVRGQSLATHRFAAQLERNGAQQQWSKAVPFVELTVAHASVLTILAISFERYYAICEPLKAGYVCTKARAFLICVLAWLFAALFTSPILFIAEYRFSEYYDTTMVPVCLMQANSIWPAVYFITTIAVFFLLPLCVLMALYTVIARHLMAEPGPPGCKSAGTPGGTLSSTSGQQQGGESSNLRARRQVVLMLGTVVVSFFICLMPFRVLTLWIIVVPSETVFRLGVEGYYNLLYFCRVMFYLNSAINPILYNLMSSKFRLGFSRLCGLRRRRRGRWRRGSELNRLQGSAADLTTVQRGDLAGSRMSGTVFTRNGTLTSLSYSSFYHNNRHNSTRLSHCDTRENNNASPKNGTRKSLIVRNPSTSLEPGTTSAGSAAVLARFTVRQGSFDAQPESYV
ncbi:Hypothetical predicted protein [Cloeon dipterum]|uniref:Thyrotropin-releasing hormone receptor n=1 Tax=Cloeon dipterum TaxID=197152 RepID=A0A8S1DTH9_9INSE|nr:Hypothetical predicted protein [Cloeon dipterum]